MKQRLPKKLPAAIQRWEADRDFLQEHAQMRMPEEDQTFNVLMIAPRELRREILKDYTLKKFPTYLHLKQHMLELVVREAEDGKRPPLGAQRRR